MPLDFQAFRKLFQKQADVALRRAVTDALYSKIFKDRQVEWKKTVLPGLTKLGLVETQDWEKFIRATGMMRALKSNDIYYIRLLYWIYRSQDQHNGWPKIFDDACHAIWGCSLEERSSLCETSDDTPDRGWVEGGVIAASLERPESIDSNILPGDHVPQVKGNVPSRLPDFVGRKRQIEEIERLLMKGHNGLLAGMGGAGKTSLAVEAAHRVSGRFADGIYFVDCLGMGDQPLDTAPIARQFAQAIEPMSYVGKGSTWLTVFKEIAKDLNCLLILDNVGSSEVVRELDTPGKSQILATARLRMAIPLGQLVDVEQMASNDAIGLLRVILPQGVADRSQLIELTVQCGGLPLALRAAATYILVHKVPVRDYLDQLSTAREKQGGQALAYLSNARVVDRTLDVEAVLGLSLERLLQDDRELAQRYLDLVSFRSDFDTLAVQAIWGLAPSDVSLSLDRLVAQNLVQRDGLTGRLQLHDLLRELADKYLVSR